MAPDKIMRSTAFAGQNVGVKQVGDRIWLGRLLAGHGQSIERLITTRSGHWVAHHGNTSNIAIGIIQEPELNSDHRSATN